MNKLIALGIIGLLIGCSPSHRLLRTLRTQPAYTDHLMGVALYDPTKGKFLIQHNATKRFIPASTTKLVSFYAGLIALPDSLPALRYVVRHDSLIFWGTGNPLLLHPDLTDTTALAFLRKRSEHLVFSPANYEGPRFGPGWAWDDYNEAYSPELTPLPIYGNVVRFADKSIVPRRFVDSVRVAPAGQSVAGIWRNEFVNQFNRPITWSGRGQDVPFRWSAQLTAQLLSDTLHKAVAVAAIAMPNETQLLKGIATDSLYERMLHVSDNQFAEQLFFMLSATRNPAQLEPARELRRVIDSVLQYTPATVRWVDGSGLSRYNLVAPTVLIDLLNRIRERVSPSRLFALMPASRPTSSQRILVPDKPYVFAKSGSMSGVYNLSGYLLTKRNKILLFSIMHNNFTKPVSDVRQQTAELISRIYAAY